MGYDHEGMGYSEKEVPQHYMQRWQQFANLMAEAAQVRAALVMRVWPEQIEVLISSIGTDNPYEPDDRADLGTGLYCETVMSGRQPLIVVDALTSPLWRNNPDIDLNMVSYLGLPLIWPDETIFGTVCVLDSVAHAYSQETQNLLRDLKGVIEEDFRVICHVPGADTGDELAARFVRAARGCSA